MKKQCSRFGKMNVICNVCRKSLGSKRKAIEEGKCDKCYKQTNLCSYDGCNKKTMINKYCSSHVSLGRPVPIKPIQIKPSAIEIALKEERRFLMEEVMNSARLQREETIKNIRESIPYDSIAAQYHYDFLDKMIQENELEIEMRKLDDAIRRLRNYFSNMGESKLPRKKFEQFDFKRHTKEPDPKTTKEETEKPRRFRSGSDTSVDFSDDQFEWFCSLGIEPTTNIRTIKMAYIKLALINHPDRNSEEDATEKFQVINNAYSGLIEELA